jgi:hypothetical protein
MIHVESRIVAVTCNRTPLSWIPDLFSVLYALRQKTQQITEQGCLFPNIIGLFIYNSVRLLGKPDMYKHYTCNSEMFSFICNLFTYLYYYHNEKLYSP